MEKVDNFKNINLPIIKKGKIDKNENTNKNTNKILTSFVIIFIVILLLLSGYSMAKMINEKIIKTNAQIAQPMLIIENNPSVDITAKNNYGEYTFKVKNYNEKNQITQADLKYYVEIISNNDNSISYEIYQEDNKINLTNNKTDYIHISKGQKIEREYKIKIKYDKNNTENANDIMEKIQIRVHTEQEKA